MSIRDILAKMGEWIKANQADIALGIGFILVAAVAFGAGRLSAPEIVRNPIIIESPAASAGANLYGGMGQQAGEAVKSSAAPGAGQGELKGMFVASKSGKKYHWPWCTWGERIKPENQVWFNSEKEAQSAGFSPCGCIASKAPAGYHSN